MPGQRHRSGHRRLERLVGVTQVRFPRIADVAQCSVAYAWFALPVLAAIEARVHRCPQIIAHLDQHPDAADRAERIDADGAEPQPLVRLLAQRLARGNYDNSVMLEVLTRRYYGNKVSTICESGTSPDATSSSPTGEGVTVASVAVNYGALGAATRGLIELASASSVPVVADIYLGWNVSPRPSTRWWRRCEIVSARPIPEQLQRITATVAGVGSTVMHHHFTFRPSLSGLTEDHLIRGLHPHIGSACRWSGCASSI